jgi:hypothetical protein
MRLQEARIYRLIDFGKWMQGVNTPTRGYALPDIYLVHPESCLLLAAMNKGSLATVGYY